MPQWRASSRRSRPNEQRAKRIGRETRQEPTCSITSNASTTRTSSLDDWISEPYGVRDQGWISLSGCHPNRVQAKQSPLRPDCACRTLLAPKLSSGKLARTFRPIDGSSASSRLSVLAHSFLFAVEGEYSSNCYFDLITLVYVTIARNALRALRTFFFGRLPPTVAVDKFNPGCF